MNHLQSPKQLKNKQKQSQSASGQIVVEYVLLLVIVVGLAALITNSVVSRDPNNPGFLVYKWSQIISTIGSDRADLVE